MLLQIIKEIEMALDNEMYISALALSLTLPDICGKAEYPKEDKAKRYMDWYNKYIGDYIKPTEPWDSDMPYSSGEVVYNLRCSVLHEGNPNLVVKDIKNERNKIERFALSIDDETDCGSSSLAYSVKEGELVIKDRKLDVNIVSFCKDMCLEATNYYNNNKDKFDFFNYVIIDRREDYEGKPLFQSKHD